MNMLNALKNDEDGFVVSAELVLVGTILVLGMIVGLTELSFNVNQELEDLGSAIGAINQTYYFTLASGKKVKLSEAGFRTMWMNATEHATLPATHKQKAKKVNTDHCLIICETPRLRLNDQAPFVFLDHALCKSGSS